jgi:uncharacterized protein (DUF362 family)
VGPLEADVRYDIGNPPAVNRRNFLHIATAAPALGSVTGVRSTPTYRVVSKSEFSAGTGLPGRYPGQAVRVEADAAVDAAANRVNAPVVGQMLSAGLKQLTGSSDDRDAWAQFITPQDVVGIKVNCSGAPEINSNPELVNAIISGLLKVGVPVENIYIYDRFTNQLAIVKYERFVPAGVQIHGAEDERGSILNYDPYTYVEVSFFGEDDTRSNLIRLISDKLTKVINVPTMKEHRAAGVTGCLKNLGYGSFSNVARSHRHEVSNTYSFIGTLNTVQPLRSRTVLHVMDGLRSLWQGGPFLQDSKFLFFPKRIVVGTDPVALDRLLIEMIEEKRAQMGAPSVFNRSPEHLKHGPELNPQFNSFIREPGHVEFAGHLGLGVYDKSQIKEQVIRL